LKSRRHDPDSQWHSAWTRTECNGDHLLREPVVGLGCAGTSAQVLPARSLPTRVAELRDAGRRTQDRARPDGGQFGVCVFTTTTMRGMGDVRGECRRRSPGDGVHTAAARLLRHHRRSLHGGRRKRRRRRAGACALPGGKACDADATMQAPVAVTQWGGRSDISRNYVTMEHVPIVRIMSSLARATGMARASKRGASIQSKCAPIENGG